MMSDKKKQISLIVAFIGFIFTISILYFVLPKSEYSEKEKKYLSVFPEFTFSNLFSGDYTESIEEFLADHTPCRELFLGINSYYNYLIMNNGSNDIYLSSDNYLIEKPISANNMLLENAEQIKEFTKKEKIDTYFLLAPSKGSILDDKLPHNHLKYNDDKYFKNIEEILGDDVKFINIFDEFKNQTEQIYYKTDHHWNMNGAYIAYNEICREMAIKPMNSEYYRKEVIDNFYGTSYANSAYWFTKPDTLEMWKSDVNVSVKIFEGEEIIESNSMFFEKHLNTEDKYSVYLDGNHPYTEIINNDNNNGETLLVVKDSYAHAVTPFLAEHFSKIVMVDLRYYKKPLSEVISSNNVTSLIYVYSLDNFGTSTDIILY